MTSKLYLALLAATLVPFVTGFAIVGCQNPKQGDGFPISSYSALKPDHLTETQCSLDLAGTKYRADIKQSRSGDDLSINLTAFGQVIESEKYRSTDQEFSLVGADREEYVPPIPLIKYPMHVGDQWDWQGVFRTGPIEHKSTAKITTASEDLMMDGAVVHNVIRVDVARSADSGIPGSPATRKLKFWIVPGMGVVKRSFGDESTRAPLEQ